MLKALSHSLSSNSLNRIHIGNVRSIYYTDKGLRCGVISLTGYKNRISLIGFSDRRRLVVHKRAGTLSIVHRRPNVLYRHVSISEWVSQASTTTLGETVCLVIPFPSSYSCHGCLQCCSRQGIQDLLFTTGTIAQANFAASFGRQLLLYSYFVFSLLHLNNHAPWRIEAPELRSPGHIQWIKI